MDADDPEPTVNNLIGGSIQATPLSLSGVVTTFAGTTGLSGSTDASGISAKFNEPRGITTDGTNLYLAEYENHTIRKIEISSGIVTTLAGSAGITGSFDGTGTSARFNTPLGITTDGSSNLYVAEYGNHTVRKIVISSGVVTTLAGSAGSTGSSDGTGISAKFNRPYQLTTDGINLFVSDFKNHTIRKVVISSGVVTTLAGSAGNSGTTNAAGTSARFYGPTGLTTEGANIYIADRNNHTIRKIQ